MFRNAAIIFVISLAFPIMGIWEFMTTDIRPPAILPEDCTVAVNEEMQLSIQGFLPRNAVALWDVDRGDIMSVLPGSEAILVAPSRPATVTITVSISPALPGIADTLTRECTVIEAD